MAKYQPGDMVTYYFVIKEVNGNKMIQGWTDSKDLANFYMDFHKCKNLTLKKMSGTIEEITKILEENLHDEIQLSHIITRNRDKSRKNPDDSVTICIPATESECRFIREEANTFMASRINYGFINDALPFMKKKYQNVLQSIFLTDVIRKVVYSQNVKFAQMVEYDSLMILLRSFPETFGE